MVDTADRTESEELESLRRETLKLRKINTALIGRVERSMDFQGNAFSLFQTAIGLEDQVSRRTAELAQALSQLELSNQALSAAKEEAETAQARLAQSIETISEGFALFDNSDRLILFNSNFRDFWPTEADYVRIGISFQELIRISVESGYIVTARTAPDNWISERLIAHRRPGIPQVFELADGRWIQVSERQTKEGGIVAVYTDITELKRSEERRRERELAATSALLQATLDNIDQGISVFDRNQNLTAWNAQFADLVGLDRVELRRGRPLHSFISGPSGEHGSNQEALFTTLHDIAGSRRTPSVAFEHKCSNGRVLEVRRNQMPDGGFVATYTDITRRKRTEEALRESERRIRLVTDAMPALIAYVDRNECYQFTNKAYEIWFDLPRSEINGRPMREVLGEAHYAKRREYVKRALDGMDVTYEMPMPSTRLTIEYGLATYVPHFNNDGEVIGFFALIQDITERRKNADALEEARINLEHRVEERTAQLLRVNQELADAKAAAEEANLSKTRFLAAASHDLLQPLNAARVFVAALAERRLSPDNQGLVRNVTSALEAVEELLNALLEISKLDAGVLASEDLHFPIGPLLASLTTEHAPMAADKGLRLSAVPADAIVRADPKLLGRILRNFLSNAIRYTPSGRILLGCRRVGGRLRVGVWDTGPGIPADKIPEIFQEFHRLPETEQSGRGAGLGLAIVERIARNIDLPIQVNSVPGRGSMFAVDLPLGDPFLVKSERPEPAWRGGDKLSGALILLIDNEPSILEAMQALLANWSCEALSAHDMAEALDLLARRRTRPDLIIADYHLDDGETGIEALKAVRDRYGGEIPAIVATADRSEDVFGAAQATGAYVIRKPLKPGKLRSLITHALSERA